MDKISIKNITDRALTSKEVNVNYNMRAQRSMVWIVGWTAARLTLEFTLLSVTGIVQVRGEFQRLGRNEE